MKSFAEVVRVIDVEPFQAGDGDAFRFRLEVLNSPTTGMYTGKVYRLETYRLQPSFPQSEGKTPDWTHDALIYVADDMFSAQVLQGASPQEVVEKFQHALEQMFGCSA